MKNLYIIAGPNGAGKTTASYTILPDILNCREFVNADEIAKGLSPFNPDNIGIQAGRLMLSRMNELLESNVSFAIETTLATKTYKEVIQKAQQKGYDVILLFLSLNSINLAIKRVKTRVGEGGHNIAEEVIKRRFKSGLTNFFKIYISTVDKWMLIDNSGDKFLVVAEGSKSNIRIANEKIWKTIKGEYDEE